MFQTWRTQLQPVIVVASVEDLETGAGKFFSLDNCSHSQVSSIMNNCFSTGEAAAVAIEAGAVETVVVDVAGARRRRWDKNNFKHFMLPCDDHLVLLEIS